MTPALRLHGLISIGFLITTVDERRKDRVTDLIHAIQEESFRLGVKSRICVCTAYAAPLRWLGAWAKADPPEVRRWTEKPPEYVDGLNEGMQILAAAPPPNLLVKMDDDLKFLDHAWLEELVYGFGRHPRAILGAKLLRPDGRVQHAGGVLLRAWGRVFGAHYGEVLEVDTPIVDMERPVEFVTGAFFAIPFNLWRELGPFDPEPGAWEDSEYCFRARESDREVWYLPKVVLEHATGQEERHRDKAQSEAYDQRMRKAEAWFMKRYADMLYPRGRT